MGAYRLNLLGGFELLSATGSPVRLSVRKHMALLAYLVEHAGQLVTKDALLEAVWSGTFQALGARIQVEHGYILAEAPRLRGAEVVFDIQTVTGTETVSVVTSAIAFT